MARNHRIVRGRKRDTLWAGIGGTATTIAAGGSRVITNSASASLLALRPFTIVRTHLEILLRTDQDVANEDQFAAAGVCVVSDQAFTIGVTAVPNPAGDASSDLWLLHQWLIGSNWRGSGGVDIAGQRGKTYSVDSKAMRKVEEGQNLIVVLETDPVVGNGVTILMAGRMLIKVH